MPATKPHFETLHTNIFTMFSRVTWAGKHWHMDHNMADLRIVFKNSEIKQLYFS